MVQVDISQLSGECSTWREALRHLRDEFTQDKLRLQMVASQALSKDQLKQVEHLHNQFHIQLINIHDLKQSIKVHERVLGFELSGTNPCPKEETMADHEKIYGQYQDLEHTLQDLRDEFNEFLNRTQ
jgi:hypothetical protein